MTSNGLPAETSASMNGRGSRLRPIGGTSADPGHAAFQSVLSRVSEEYLGRLQFRGAIATRFLNMQLDWACRVRPRSDRRRPRSEQLSDLAAGFAALNDSPAFRCSRARANTVPLRLGFDALRETVVILSAVAMFTPRPHIDERSPRVESLTSSVDLDRCRTEIAADSSSRNSRNRNLERDPHPMAASWCRWRVRPRRRGSAPLSVDLELQPVRPEPDASTLPRSDARFGTLNWNRGHLPRCGSDRRPGAASAQAVTQHPIPPSSSLSRHLPRRG